MVNGPDMDFAGSPRAQPRVRRSRQAANSLSSLRTQGPITTGCGLWHQRAGPLSFRRRTLRGMGPCVRRDDS